MIDIPQIHKLLLHMAENLGAKDRTAGAIGRALAPAHHADSTKRQWASTRLGHAQRAGYVTRDVTTHATFWLTDLGMDLVTALRRAGR